MTYRIFISSVQREFAKERKALADYIRKDRFFIMSRFRNNLDLQSCLVTGRVAA